MPLIIRLLICGQSSGPEKEWKAWKWGRKEMERWGGKCKCDELHQGSQDGGQAQLLGQWEQREAWQWQPWTPGGVCQTICHPDAFGEQMKCVRVHLILMPLVVGFRGCVFSSVQPPRIPLSCSANTELIANTLLPVSHKSGSVFSVGFTEAVD